MPNRVVAEKFHFDHLNRNDPESLRHYVANRLLYSVGKDPQTATPADWYTALAQVARDRLVERWMETTRRQYAQKSKRVYYLSMEFLTGRALGNALMATGLYDDLAKTELATNNPMHIRVPRQNNSVQRSTATRRIRRDSGLRNRMPAKANASPRRLEGATKTQGELMAPAASPNSSTLMSPVS